jgi:hypothetical protein
LKIPDDVGSYRAKKIMITNLRILKVSECKNPYWAFLKPINADSNTVNKDKRKMQEIKLRIIVKFSERVLINSEDSGSKFI